jgi:outer membrane autotransporter protein
MNSQVGTWRQRMGVIDKTIQGKPSLWARTFQDSGTIEPDALGGNFGAGGNLAFDQRNSGTEVGADFALSDKLSVGVLLAKVDANQKLSGAGVDKFNGDTRGLYATWISPGGFYLDASYRWMDFDARLTSAAGEMQTHGEADALNLELGYAWTLANGLKIEPQFQHTRVKVGDVDALSVGSANFRSDGGDSSRDRLGVMFRESFGSNGTVWTPYASVNAVHTSDGRSAYSIDDTFFGASSTGGTSALIEGGLSVQIGHLSIFGSANWQDGGALQSFSGGQLGLRYNW